VPADAALDPEFDLSGLTGRWFITAGLNPLFDIFDCQVRSRRRGAARGGAAALQGGRRSWPRARARLPAAPVQRPRGPSSFPPVRVCRPKASAPFPCPPVHVPSLSHLPALPRPAPPRPAPTPAPQEHFFLNPEPGRMQAQINWRISKPGGDFMERTTIQRFVQDEARPGVLYNHGNEYLHYEVWGGGTGWGRGGGVGVGVGAGLRGLRGAIHERGAETWQRSHAP
jgi:hypothetical protein